MHRKPPNILLIITDQQWAGAMSCAGNEDLHTPNLDRLAREGVRFTDAYCTFPMCVPARASMLTGRMPSTLGMAGAQVHECRIDYPDDAMAQTLGRLFREAGYRCGWGGKWHAGLRNCSCPLPPLEKLDHGFEKVCGFDDRALPEACARFLQQHDGSRPFLLVASFDNPHNICEFSRDRPLPWCDLPAAPPASHPNLPANFQPTPFEPEVIASLRRNPVAQATVGRDVAFDLPRWREERYAYARLVEHVDAQIGQVLGALTAAGCDDDTLVVFTSDHGEMQGAHRLAHKWVLYDESTCIPLIVRDPRGGRRGETDAALISNGLDLLPTLCDYAGIEPPSGLHGQSLAPRLRDPRAACRDQVVVETVLPDGCGTRGRMVRTAQFAYHLYNSGRYAEQLFDMHRDRGQMVNLAVEARYVEVLDDHRQRLAQWCRMIGDRGLCHYARPGHAAIPGLGWVPLASTSEQPHVHANA